MLKSLAPTFEQETGAKVIMEDTPWAQLYEKVALELSSGANRYSAMLLPAQWIQSLNQYLEPIDDKDLISDDFLESLVNLYQYDGKQYGVPYYVMVLMLYYRTDIFEAAGLEPPETWEEFTEVMVALKEKLPSIDTNVTAPTSIPLKRTTHSSAFFNNYLWGLGKDVIDSSGTVTLDCPEARESLQFMSDLYNKYQVIPENSFELSFTEASDLFSQGRLASCFDYNRAIATYSDPEASQIVGKWDCVATPGDSAYTGPWGITMPLNAPEKELGYAFIRWITNEENMTALAEVGSATGRKSTYSAPSVVEKIAQMPQIMNGALVGRVETWPQYEAVSQILLVGISDAVSQAKTVDQAITDMTAEITALLSD